MRPLPPKLCRSSLSPIFTSYYEEEAVNVSKKGVLAALFASKSLNRIDGGGALPRG